MRARMSSRREALAKAAARAALAAWPRAGISNAVQSTAGRAALVIGNDRYLENPLGNAGNDARAMAALLSKAGFKVDLSVNATLAGMTAAIDSLGRTALNPDVGSVLFFYAGHAAQLDWNNYLLPVDCKVQSADDIPAQCLDLGMLMSRLGRAKGTVSLIFLDSCRDNPFGTRLRLADKGMSPYDAPAGTLLAFSTAPGRVAVEVVGSPNGLYTEHLLRELSVKGTRIEDALKRVRLNVRLASNGFQVPGSRRPLKAMSFCLRLRRRARRNWSGSSAKNTSCGTGSGRRRMRTTGSPTFSATPTASSRRSPRCACVACSMSARCLRARHRWRATAGSASSAEGNRKKEGKGGNAGKETKTAARREPLRLGPGQQVPKRLQGSGNPHSAGTYAFRPIWTPGDEYVYEHQDLYSGVARGQYRLMVRRVDVEGNRVELSDGSWLDLAGCPLREGRHRRYDLPLQINPAELQVGRRWRSRFELSGAQSGSGEYDFRIAERTTLTVPAGTFSAFRIEGVGSFRGRAIRLTRWMVPGLNVALRREVRETAGAQVLVSARQAVSG
ncbi:MAG TPA: caspase family protein [Burkholderiaceae bacterium]|nr:caspase family protein [Burkholderiaceae bacterium]